MNKKIEINWNKIPQLPGIYLWKDKNDNVIYVGKAKNLRSRMHQYFKGSINSYKTNKMISEIFSYEIFIVNNNKEALLLERQYIEKFNPEYNILLLDDKNYPYIKIELKKGELLIKLTKKYLKNDSNNSLLFGPFPNGYGAKVILKLLQREAFFEKGLKIQSKDEKFWKNQFDKIKNILTFDNKNYIKELEEKRKEADKKWQFEISLDLTRSIEYLKKLKEDQIIELKNNKNIDVLSYKIENNLLYVTILFYRYGILINKDSQIIPIMLDEKHLFESFFDKYYKNKIIPDEIVVPEKLLDLNLELTNENINFHVAKNGIYKLILQTCELNLEEFYKNEAKFAQNKINKGTNNLELLKTYIPLDNLKNIVAFDNSNFNNYNPVGVAIVYTNGLKNKNAYRKYSHEINFSRQADVEYMQKSITNYLSNLDTNIVPDLIIVDGALAQVHEAKKVIKRLNMSFPVVGLVKDDNHKTKFLIDLEEKQVPIKNRDLKNFLAEIQEEVDRFAKDYLRKKHRITSLEGKLRSINGIGEKIEFKLLEKFGNYNNIYNATLEELEKVVPKSIAKKIFNKEYIKKSN
ncbi:GIY-YIG nuclease family protein [Mycoplasmopsis meleagridis]|uniref:GIY-YIG nuclease family protein n=1 Tax=Mycoplasmopsis meleagridis TaxID=29561 RepID=UPI00073D5B7D|nr:GIY-YIG nuclease family protein [Mycoplasmopsis meleagridis]KUH47365.1 excinuclease ABC subunit C [Mycoplasmopsis meleagridis]